MSAEVRATRTPLVRHYATTGGVGMAYGPRGYLYELEAECAVWVDRPAENGGPWLSKMGESSVVEFARKVSLRFGRGTHIIITDTNTGERIERVAK